MAAPARLEDREHWEHSAWTTDPVGNPYVSSVVTTEDYSNATQVQKQTTQTLDQYGNVTQLQVFDYGAPGGPPQTTAARTYANTYLTNNGNYTSRWKDRHAVIDYLRQYQLLPVVPVPRTFVAFGSTQYHAA